jgi:DNA-binding LytR/AlgR family response regulator
MIPARHDLTALVVDDEPIARQILREELGDLGVGVLGEAENGDQAVTQIHSLHPELVFLDLQMPGGGGFDVIRRLEGSHPLPSIVIVTAFDHHAIEAFDAGAIDYLLKPVGRDRLAKCLDRVRRTRQNGLEVAEQALKLQEIAQVNPTAASNAAPASNRPRKIVGKVGDEFHLLDSSQVLAFQADQEMVWIITKKQRYLATQPLKKIEEKLMGLNFARIHRQSLVNLDHVAKIAPLSSRRWLLTLANDQEFIVSKRQAMAVQELLSW